MSSRTHLRLLFVVVLLIAGSPFVATALSGNSDPYAGYAVGETITSPRESMTAFSSQSGHLIVIAPDGSVKYHGQSYDKYWDVDFMSNSKLLVTATEEVKSNNINCDPLSQRGRDYCMRQRLLLVNITTGEEQVLYERVDPRSQGAEWHDADHIKGDKFVVADMYNNGIFIVNTTSDIKTWAWSAQQEYRLSSGGPFPSDWTHVNDVDVLQSGKFMVSMRNHDQVVFLSKEDGLIDSMTLGSDDNHSILFEQHNPDYIPKSKGGPAIVVGDSENNRVVEYERQNGSWERTWAWSIGRTGWTRDADRLPNNHTLINNGGEIVEINIDGEVVWRVRAPNLYEADRYVNSTGATASAAGIVSKTAEPGERPLIVRALEFVLPAKLVSAILFITPVWMGISHYLGLSLFVVTSVCWIVLELLWLNITLRNPVIKT